MGRLHSIAGWARRRPDQFLIAWLTLVLLLVLGGGSYNLLQEWRSIYARNTATAKDYTSTLAHRVEAAIATADVLLNFIASDAERGLGPKSDTALAAQFDKVLRNHPELMAVMVVPADGHPAPVTRPSMSPTLDFSDRDYFQYHRTHEGTELHISPPVISRLTGKAVIPLTQRLNDRHGQFAGVAFVGLRPDYFEQEFKKLTLGKNGATAFTTSDGTILFRYPAVAGALGKSISNWPVFTDFVKPNESGVGESACPVDGVVRLHAFRHLTRYPIIAFSGVAIIDLKNEWMATAKLKVALLLAVLFLLTGSGWMMYRQLQREADNKIRLKASLRRADHAHQHAQLLNEHLQSAMDFQAAVLNSTACGILVTDSQGTLTFMNASASKTLGFQNDELIGKTDPLVFHRTEDIREALQFSRPGDTPYLLMVAHVNAHPTREWRFVRKNGATVTVSLLVTPLKDPEGRLKGFVTIFNDLTELNQLDGLKSDFVSVVSHELRTPVTAIRGALSLHLAAMQDSLPASQQRLLTIATDNCDRLIKIVSDILDIDKLAHNKLMLNCKNESIASLIERAITQTQPFADLHNVTYRIGIDSADIAAFVDADRLIQVLVNLLSNAAKFSHPHGEVIVSAGEENGAVVLRVVDNGIGIAEELHGHMFERFAQHSAALTRKTGGTGLGLAITKKLVEAHGGTISFTSMPGQGTTFVVSLPMAGHATATHRIGNVTAHSNFY